MLYTQLFSNFQPKTTLASKVRWLRAVLWPRLAAGVLLLMVVVAAPASGAGLPDIAVQTPPDLTELITDSAGNPLSLNDYKGTPIVVNFLAIWCPPCVAELPTLDRATQLLADIPIKVVLISVDRGGAAKVVPFLQDRDITLPDLGFDPKGRLPQQFGIRGLPTTILISADQTQSWAFVGPFEWDQPAVLEDIKRLLVE